MAKTDGSLQDKVIASTIMTFMSYSISGDWIVWDQLPATSADHSISLFNWKDGRVIPIPGYGLSPILRGDTLLLTFRRAGICVVGCGPGTEDIRIEAYSISAGTSEVLADYSPRQGGAIALFENNVMVFDYYNDDVRTSPSLYAS